MGDNKRNGSKKLKALALADDITESASLSGNARSEKKDAKPNKKKKKAPKMKNKLISYNEDWEKAIKAHLKTDEIGLPIPVNFYIATAIKRAMIEDGIFPEE